MQPAPIAYYDGCVRIDLSEVKPMIALPFHPSNAYTIKEFLANAEEILKGVEEDARRRFPKADPHLTDKIHDGGVWADQGVIAGCAGGLFDNITEAADILRGKFTGSEAHRRFLEQLERRRRSLRNPPANPKRPLPPPRRSA